jgi:hypothetical protein
MGNETRAMAMALLAARGVLVLVKIPLVLAGILGIGSQD